MMCICSKRPMKNEKELKKSYTSLYSPFTNFQDYITVPLVPLIRHHLTFGSSLTTDFSTVNTVKKYLNTIHHYCEGSQNLHPSLSSLWSKTAPEVKCELLGGTEYGFSIAQIDT